MSVKTEKLTHSVAATGSIALGVLFLAAAGMKLAGLPMMSAMFEGFGLPHWTLYAVAAFELGLGALLLFPATRFFGALGACVLMLGASAVHLASGYLAPMVFLNAALFAGAAWVASKSGAEAHGFHRYDQPTDSPARSKSA